MARARITAFGCCTEKMCKLLGLGSSSDMSASVKLHFSVEEVPGCV